MGKVVTTRYWVTQTCLELTKEDTALREKRRKARQDGEICPSLLLWHELFVLNLEKCPYCGKAPEVNAIWRPDDGYRYKIVCCYEGTLNCGDWYPQLSRAGLDWNYRAREAAGGPHKHCPHW